PRRTGVVGKLLRRHEPRNGGKLAFSYILSELIKNITLRNLRDAFLSVVEIGHVFHLVVVRVTGIGGKRLFVKTLRAPGKFVKCFGAPSFQMIPDLRKRGLVFFKRFVQRFLVRGARTHLSFDFRDLRRKFLLLLLQVSVIGATEPDTVL